MKQWLVTWVVSILCLPALVVAADAPYKEEYKMSVVVGSKLPWGEAATQFADLVRERTQGRIKVKVYPAASLMAGKQTNEFLMLRQGVVDFALASTINWSSTIKPLNLFNLPFFFPDYTAVDQITGGTVGEQLNKLIKNKGVTILAWGENGYRELSNSQHPVVKPADLKGLKIRVVGTPIFIETMKAFGANPVNMNWAEAQVAFQQGVVDGQENPVVGVQIPVKIWEYHRYLTVWHYVIDPLMLAVNNQVWNSLTPTDRMIVRQAAIEATDRQKQIVRKGLIPSDLSAYQFLKDQGMEVTILTPEQLAEFKKLTQPIYDQWVPKIGVNLVEAARQAIQPVERLGSK